MSAHRFATTGWDISSDPARHEAVRGRIGLSISVYRFCSRGCDAKLNEGCPAGDAKLKNEIIPMKQTSNHARSITKRVVTLAGSDFSNQDVRQTDKRLCGLISLNSTTAPARDEARRSFGIWKRSRLDTSATRSLRLGKEMPLVRETGLQQSCHQFGSTFTGSGWTIPVEVVSLPFP